MLRHKQVNFKAQLHDLKNRLVMLEALRSQVTFKERLYGGVSKMTQDQRSKTEPKTPSESQKQRPKTPLNIKNEDLRPPLNGCSLVQHMKQILSSTKTKSCNYQSLTLQRHVTEF